MGKQGVLNRAFERQVAQSLARSSARRQYRQGRASAGLSSG